MTLLEILEEVESDPKTMQKLVRIISNEFHKRALSFIESDVFLNKATRNVTNLRFVALMDERRKRAAASTYDFIDAHLSYAAYQPSKYRTWKKLLGDIGEGVILQFGVWEGKSINELATMLPNRTIHGFDSFEGLPEDWTHSLKGAFDLQGKLPEVKDNVVLHKGWFDVTLPQWMETNHEQIAFLDIDCDLYSSASCVLQNLKGRIRKGTIIHFDELFGYYGWQHHEYKALTEFLADTGFEVEYLGYGSSYACCRII